MLWPKASPGTKPPDSIQKEEWLELRLAEGYYYRRYYRLCRRQGWDKHSLHNASLHVPSGLPECLWGPELCGTLSYNQWQLNSWESRSFTDKEPGFAEVWDQPNIVKSSTGDHSTKENNPDQTDKHCMRLSFVDPTFYIDSWWLRG